MISPWMDGKKPSLAQRSGQAQELAFLCFVTDSTLFDFGQKSLAGQFHRIDLDEIFRVASLGFRKDEKV